MHLLLTGAIALPTLVGLVLLVAGRSLSLSLRRGLTLGALLLAAGCATALLGYAGQDPGIAIEWLPGTGTMTLGLALSSLFVLLATAWAAALASLTGWEGWERGTGYGDALTLLGLAATGIALLAGHFLLRYVALEIVALCVALAPLVAWRDGHSIRSTFLVYLLLRIGDAGLLSAIVALWATAGTLEIGPALAAAWQMPAPVLGLTAAGFLLAVWVKIGAWPFQVWSSIGQRLAPRHGAWLYGTVFPNLGLYLLYRTAPLFRIGGPLGQAALWLGAGGAVLAALLALRQRDLDQEMTLPHVFAALGGLVVVAASGGLQVAIWLSVWVLTPIRVLLHLAARTPERDPARPIGAGLGAVGVVGWALILTYWARDAGLPAAALHVAELAVALLGVWVVLTIRSAWSVLRVPYRERVRPARWAGMGLLGLAVGASPWMVPALWWAYWAYHGMPLELPLALPTLRSLFRYLLSTPALWVVAALVVVVDLWGKERLRRSIPPARKDVPSLEAGELWLGRFSHAVRRTIEGQILEKGLAQGVYAVLRGSRLIHRYIEQGVLERMLVDGVRVTMHGSRLVYQHVEQATLEGALRRVVQGIVHVARVGQSLHTGRLRRNLLWIAASVVLALAVLLLVW
jgi:NADH:ubiquinone oxidoreductase subunit 4 (subunit M)